MVGARSAWAVAGVAVLAAACGVRRDASLGAAGGKGASYPDSDWEPGEPIPGWEVGDCAGITEGAVAVEWLPGSQTRALSLFADGMMDLAFEYRDCAEFDCSDAGVGQPELWVRLLSAYDADQGHGTGMYPYAPERYHAVIVADAPSGWVGCSGRDDPYDNAKVDFCVETLQPDVISMAVLATIEDTTPGFDSSWAPYLSFGATLLVSFDDHAAFEYGHGDQKPVVTADPLWAYGDISYDDAWPWDQITDPAVREEVYWRYLPYNLMEEE